MCGPVRCLVGMDGLGRDLLSLVQWFRLIVVVGYVGSGGRVERDLGPRCGEVERELLVDPESESVAAGREASFLRLVALFSEAMLISSASSAMECRFKLSKGSCMAYG